MKADVVLHQLLALRAQVDAMIAMVTSAEEPGGCEHPEERRQDLSTMGGPKQFMCGVCGETIEEEG